MQWKSEFNALFFVCFLIYIKVRIIDLSIHSFLTQDEEHCTRMKLPFIRPEDVFMFPAYSGSDTRL